MTQKIEPNKLLLGEGFVQTYNDVFPTSGSVNIVYAKDNVELQFHRTSNISSVEVTVEIEIESTKDLAVSFDLNPILLQGINQVVNQITFMED